MKFFKLNLVHVQIVLLVVVLGATTGCARPAQPVSLDETSAPEIISDEQALEESSTPKISIVEKAVVPVNSVTWGPSYYGDDINLEVQRNRDDLEFMKQVDQKALRGVTEGPSYSQ